MPDLLSGYKSKVIDVKFVIEQQINAAGLNFRI